MTMEQFVPLIPVPEHLRFDEVGLDRFIRRNVADFSSPLVVEQFGSGQSNPTYRVIAGDRRYVLRRKPPGKLLPSAHQVDREYRVITALRESGVPVPRTYALCEDPGVIGTAFYLMEYVYGRNWEDPTLPGLSPQERTVLFSQANEIMTRLHQVDYVKVGLGDYGRAGGFIERQVSRWTKQYRASETERIDAMERLIEWLPPRIPREDESTIIHGDFRLGNMLMHPTEPRILAVLDWELSTIGHPLADFAYHCMQWRLPVALRGMYGADLKALGIPSEEEHVFAYCRRTGRSGIPHWEYYVVFNFFRLAAINQGIVKRAQEGTASSDRAMEMGTRARGIAECGWREAQKVGT